MGEYLSLKCANCKFKESKPYAKCYECVIEVKDNFEQEEMEDGSNDNE